jgi:hypothetical protein
VDVSFSDAIGSDADLKEFTRVIEDGSPKLNRPRLNIDSYDARSHHNILSSIVSAMVSELTTQHDVVYQRPQDTQTSIDEVIGSGETGLNKTILGMELRKCSENSRYVQKIPVPSRFSITSVDPLHFLGITPTVRSAELLHACGCSSDKVAPSRH